MNQSEDQIHRSWGLARLWEVIGPQHAVDPGTLGEYGQVLLERGIAAAAAEFPAVAVHLAAGCDACHEDLEDIRSLLQSEEREASRGALDAITSQVAALQSQLSAVQDVLRGLPERMQALVEEAEQVRSRELQDLLNWLGPKFEEVQQARAREMRDLFDSLTAPSSYALASLRPAAFSRVSDPLSVRPAVFTFEIEDSFPAVLQAALLGEILVGRLALLDPRRGMGRGPWAISLELPPIQSAARRLWSTARPRQLSAQTDERGIAIFDDAVTERELQGRVVVRARSLG